MVAGSYRISEVPLFRSYLFINIDPRSEEYYTVLGTTGVSSIVKRAEKPCPVSFGIIKSLKHLVEKMNQEIGIITGLRRGERVRVIKGPLRGSEGEMVRIDNRKFVFVVNVDLLGRSVEVSIPPEYVSKL
jgi:transcriptional antiterminator NusG